MEYQEEKSKLGLRSKRLLISLLCLVTSVLYAAQDDSAQQALQQLRLLQNRFTQKGAGDTLPAPPGQANAQPSSLQALPVNQVTTVRPLSAEETREMLKVENNPEDQIEDKAFKAVEKQLFPLEPNQIKHLHKKFNRHAQAQAADGDVPPKPTASSQFVNLSPGSTPPVIRLAQGFVSSLVFLDSTGQPWPIAAYDLGDPSAFNIQWDHTSNTLMIQALKLYNYGNLAVRLQGLNTPVMLTLIPGQKAVDYRVDLRIQGIGPNAKGLLMEETLPEHANNVLLHVLDGVPPPGSSRLRVSGGDALAWFSNGKMYVRTNLTILSPGWISSMTSADGTHAYEMMKSPVLLVSWHGKVMQLIVEGL